jgi:hypothetical protein
MGVSRRMTDARRRHLDQLTARWRERQQARLASDGRKPADAEREARAAAFFPWKTQTPAEYAATFGAAMVGYTYDAYTYGDPSLEAWLSELGDLLRRRGRRC